MNADDLFFVQERISYDIAEDDLLEDDVLGNEGDLTLNELVTQGKFAVIYTATYIKNEMPLLVAAKLLKGFNVFIILRKNIFKTIS